MKAVKSRDLHYDVPHLEVEGVTASLSVLSKEVKVKARHPQPLGVGRGAKAGQRSIRTRKRVHGLMRRGLGQPRIRLNLALDRAGLQSTVVFEIL